MRRFTLLKTFVIDTNVLLYDPSCLKLFQNNEVIIPLPVLDELDNTKSRPDALGRNARAVVRLLDELRSRGSLSEGVKLKDTVIKVELNHIDYVPEGLVFDKRDNRIIGVAIGLQKEGKNVVVISKDINVRVKCNAVGLPAEDYETDKVAETPTEVYGGAKTIEVSSSLVDKLFADGKIPCNFEGFQNQFFLLRSEEREQHAGIARLVGDELKVVRDIKELSGITPRNLEQRMALDLLLDPNIKLVTLIGRAGSGKTLMAASAGLNFVLRGSKYNRMLLSRPIQPMGRDIGYLPGDINEKLDPWMQPLYDNLEFLLGGKRDMLYMYKDQGIIQVEPLTYIRGRSIPNAFMILDEAQNLQPEEIKTIITRAGENTKIVITGDIEQIDNPYVDFADNGLTHVIECFKQYSIAGHITLQKCERSELAELGAQIL